MRAHTSALTSEQREKKRERDRRRHARHYARRRQRAAETIGSYAAYRTRERRAEGQRPRAEYRSEKARAKERRLAGLAQERAAKRKPWYGLLGAERQRVRYRLDPEFRRNEIMRAFVRKKRLRDAADGTVTVKALRDLWLKTTLCYLCRKRVTDQDKSFDHCVPIAHGGKHSMNNLAVVHLRCNLSKSASRSVLL